MAYVTPIFDRTAADVAAQESKAHFNVSDWVRTYGNSSEVNTLITSTFGASVSFSTLSAPDTETIPTVTLFNTFLANIEAMRLWFSINQPAIVDDPLFVEIKDDWEAGQNKPAPNYVDNNSWEKVLDLMYNAMLNITAGRLAVSGVAISGAGMTRNAGFRQ